MLIIGVTDSTEITLYNTVDGSSVKISFCRGSKGNGKRIKIEAPKHIKIERNCVYKPPRKKVSP